MATVKVSEVGDTDDDDAFEDRTQADIESANPKERKKARRLRIQRRLDAVRKFHLPEGERAEEEIEQTAVEKQIDQSWETLQKKINIGDEYISNVRVAADCREVRRRKELIAEQKRQSSKLESEANAAEDMFQKVSANWHMLSISTDPLHIDNGLQQQKIKCDELLKRKNDLIDALDNELKFKDVKYAKEERLMKEDLRSMVDRIDKQAILMRKAFETELEMITEAILTERLEVLSNNKSNVENLFALRDEKESLNLKTQMDLFYAHEHEMHRLIEKHQEQFRDLKRSLNGDVESLQRELQSLRALCLINSETMDYNYQVLKRREDENIVIKSSQARKINKLQDDVNRLRKKIEDYNSGADQDIQKLTEEVLKLNSNILDIERKSGHFAKVNDLRYREVWKMNSNEAQSLLKRIFDIDKIIHEQLLGLTWRHPATTEILFSRESSRDSKEARNLGGLVDSDLDTRKLTQEPTSDTVAKAALLNRLFRLIAERSDYLIEDRLTVLLAPYTYNDQTIINLDNVFAALQIKKEEDIDILLSFMMPYTYCETCISKVDGKFAIPEPSELVLKPASSEIKTGTPSSTSVFLKDDDSDDTSRMSLSNFSLETPKADVVILDHPKELIMEIVSSFSHNRERMKGSFFDIDVVSTQSLEMQHWNVSNSQLDSLRSISSSSSSIVGHEMAIKDIQDKEDKVGKFRCPQGHILSMHLAYIVRGIKDFSIAFNTQKEDDVVTIASRLTRIRSTVSRLVTEQEVKTYWGRFRLAFPPKSVQVWDSLIIALKRYHAILKDRKEICNEVVKLRKQNAECRQILRDLFKISDDQYLPPLRMTYSSQSLATTDAAFLSVSSKRSQSNYKPKFKYRVPR